MKTNGIYRQFSKLCPGDRFPTQQRILDDAHIPGIGQWFIDHEKTQSWLNGKKGDRVLWLHGPSASGKTFLCSTLVNHVHQNISKGVGVFYLGRNDLQYNLADYDLAFRSITRQLVSQTHDSLAFWRWVMDNEDIGVEDLTGTSDILEKTAVFLGERVVVVLDDVDARNESGLADLLDLLLRKRKKMRSLRILMTSREPAPYPDRIRGHGITEIEARPNESDLALYLSSHMDKAPVDPEVLHEPHTNLFPYQRFIDISHGLFLPLLPKWLSNVASQPDTTLLDLVDVELPDIPDAFCRAVVNDLQYSEQAAAIFCLLWHIVKCDEMGYFFTAPMAREALDAWGLRNQDGVQFTTDEIVKCCEDLVFLDSQNQVMILRSPLLMDYLRARVEIYRLHERQATTSIRYLSKPDFANGACKSSQELKQRFQTHPYLWFAAKTNLPKTLPPSFETDFFAFAAMQGNLESYLQAREAWHYLDDETYNECEKDTERWPCYARGTTALGLAVTLGNEAILRRFIDQGADVEARDGDGNTPLHIAAYDEDQSHMLRVLLQAGSNVAVVNDDGLTPLAIAIVHGRLESAELLVGVGADVWSLDEEDLRQCVEERPGIAAYLDALGVEMPEEDEDEDMDD